MDITSKIAVQGQTGLLLSVHSCLPFVSACFYRRGSIFFYLFLLIFVVFLFGKLTTTGERKKWRLASKTHEAIFLGLIIYGKKKSYFA